MPLTAGKLPDISFNFGADATTEMIPGRLENLAAAGAKRVMLDAVQLIRAADEPDWKRALQKGLRDNGLTLFDVHAPHKAKHSFGYPAEAAYDVFFSTADKALETAAELGVRTVTFHTARTRRVGMMADEYGVFEKADLERARSRILFQLERILPKAEKLGLMIALENLFLPSSTADFLVSLIRQLSHPDLGLNYDSGHALLLEKQPGKKSEDIVEKIRIGWDDDLVVFQEDQLDAMLPYVITGHFHDNNGKADEHKLPGQGIADWKRITGRLRRAPRLISIQSEVSPKYYGNDPGSQMEAFRRCGFVDGGDGDSATPSRP